MTTHSAVTKYFVADLLALLARVVSGAGVQFSDESVPTALAQKQRVYIANHSSHLDFIVLWSALPTPLRRVTRPVAAKEYWEANTWRRYLATQIYDAILIDREHVSLHNNPIEIVAQAMGEVSSIILFPEGTRGSGEEIGSFKSGIYHLVCKKPHLECVPVYLENLNRVLPKGEILPLPLLSSLRFGVPVHLEEGESKPEFLSRLREAVVALKENR